MRTNFNFSLFSLVQNSLKILFSFFIFGLISNIFSVTYADLTVSGSVANENSIIAFSVDSENFDTNMLPEIKSPVSKEDGSGEIKTESKVIVKDKILEKKSISKQDTEAEKKDKEKTMNDINTFLIESYKIKIDKILINLNLSIERVTNNDPVAQAQLLEKIQSAISLKIQTMNTREISENRKKVLSSVFSYIQTNLDAKISQLVGQK